MPTEPPGAVVDEALRLTRLARGTTGEERAAYRRRRSDLLAEHEYVARVREADEGRRTRGGTDPAGPGAWTSGGRAVDVLVVYPSGWIENGTVCVERIDDLSRAVERPLDHATSEDWESVETHNREIAARVQREHGTVHGATAHAFADFLGNHYLRRVEYATKAHVEEFIDEYFIRNAWPSRAQRDSVRESLTLVFDTARVSDPPIPDEPSGRVEDPTHDRSTGERS